MLTPSHSSTLPPPSRLESTCTQLLEAGEFCLLVGFVEKWAETQDPTVEARLLQAEAMLRLRLMDKAWVRLKALVDDGVGGVRPHALSAQMFIDRGWPAKARKVIAEGLELRPDDGKLLALQKAVEQERPSIDVSRVDAEDVTLDELTDLAEHFMVQGAFVRARSLLERVRRTDGGVPARSRQLLQALDGNFELDEPITDIVARHTLSLVTLNDLGDLGDEGDDHTESASRADLPLHIDRDDVDDRFPSLFRNLDEESVPESTADLTPDSEVTAITSMADMRSALDSVRLDDPQLDSRAGDDTQIMRVVHRGGMEPVAPGAAHTHTPEPDASFNLADFQREMGMVPRSMASDMDFVGPEDEDESVVMVTRQEDFDDAGLDAPERGGLTLDTTIEAEAAKALGNNADEDWESPSNEPEPEPESLDLPVLEPEEQTPVSPAETRHRASEEAPHRPAGVDLTTMAVWPWWLAVIVLLGALGALLFIAFILVVLLQ